MIEKYRNAILELAGAAKPGSDLDYAVHQFVGFLSGGEPGEARQIKSDDAEDDVAALIVGLVLFAFAVSGVLYIPGLHELWVGYFSLFPDIVPTVAAAVVAALFMAILSAAQVLVAREYPVTIILTAGLQLILLAQMFHVVGLGAFFAVTAAAIYPVWALAEKNGKRKSMLFVLGLLAGVVIYLLASDKLIELWHEMGHGRSRNMAIMSWFALIIFLDGLTSAFVKDFVNASSPAEGALKTSALALTSVSVLWWFALIAVVLIILFAKKSRDAGKEET